MRKHVLTVAALTVLAAGSAVAQPMPSQAQRLHHAAGAPVYDLSGFRVGRIAGYAVQAGTPSAIVALDGPQKDVAINLQNLEPRPAGGWLATLQRGNVLELYPWYPGSVWAAG